MATAKNPQEKINVLLVGLMTNGAMGDNFITVANYLAPHLRTHILSNSNIRSAQIKTSQNFLAVPFLRYQILTFFNPLTYWRLVTYIIKCRADVIYFLTPHPVNIIISLLFFYKPQIYYLHDPFLHSGLKKFDRAVIQFEYWVINKIVKKIIVAAKKLRQEMIDRHWHHYPPRQIKVIYLGLLNNLVFPLKKRPAQFDLLFFGRIEAYKGLDTLIQAMRELEDTKITCCLAGQGDIQEIYPNIGPLPANITRINRYLPDAELAELIQNCHGIILPYHDATGTQTIPLAFYYGKPVIATQVGSLGEYITHQKDGLLVPPDAPDLLAQQIRHLFAQPSLLNKLSHGAKQSFEQKFYHKKIAASHLKVISGILNV
ncbi:MAG: glycosyltransferase family 4 protein [Patescibacteria group bacterium]